MSVSGIVFVFFFLMIRRPPRSTQSRSSAASDVYKRQGHVSLGQLKVISAIESCRTAALGGHVMRCADCLHTQIAYNSCRNRHCPKCQGSQALAWMKPVS